VIDHAAAAVAQALAVGADAALFARSSEPAMTALCARIADGLAAVARRVLDRAHPGGLVVTGAQTARAVCDALGIAGIELVDEIEPGVPLGKTADGQLDVVAGAGTFGDRPKARRRRASGRRRGARGARRRRPR
jgi:uncharacterized protein YgbK (DUF1537 family)